MLALSSSLLFETLRAGGAGLNGSPGPELLGVRHLAPSALELLARLIPSQSVTGGAAILLGFGLALAVSPGAGLSVGGAFRSSVRRHALLATVLLGSLITSVVMWSLAKSKVGEYERVHFQREIDLVRDALTDRMQRYEESLTRIRRAYQQAGKADTEGWKEFARSLEDQKIPSGLRLIAVVEAGPDGRPSRSQGATAILASRSPSPSDHALRQPHQEPAISGQHDKLGYWVASSKAFQEAAGRTFLDTGRPVVSGSKKLAFAAGEKLSRTTDLGFFLVLPVLEQTNTAQTPRDRHSPIRSWLAAFVTIAEMMEVIRGAGGTEIELRLYDGAVPSEDKLLYESVAKQAADGRVGRDVLSHTVTIPFGGRTWTLDASAPEGMDLPFSRNLADRLLMFTVAAIVLFMGVVLAIDRGRRKVEAAAAAAARRFAETEARLGVEHQRREAALRESEERYTLAARAALDGLWDWNLQNNEIDYSPRWKALLGFDELELSRSPDEWLHRVHPEDRGRLLTKLSDHLAGRTARFESEHRLLHRNGVYRWMLTRGLAVRDEQGKARRIAGSQTDITASRQAEKRLLHAALHDPLTGLPNRSYFMERLASAGRKSRKNPQYRFALLFLDVDRFKVVNDSLGHMVGDELLVSIGRRLKTCVRPTDTIARLGGDEFAILLDKLNQDIEATVIADRIQKEMARPFSVGDQEVYTALSIGITFSSASHERTEDLMRNADTAMYRAKAQGKARYELFDQGMHAHLVERLHIETDLRRGLERNELLVHYQPIVSLASGRIIGCEALIRWQHPERGLVLPGEFIPVAEETGLIMPVSEWLLETACSQMRAWQDSGLPPIQLSVNISPRQFGQHDVFDVVDQALKKSGLDPSLLQLELTESALMENADATIKPLVELYAKGVQISLDDFGTGYSSLIYLRRFPIGTLKISESFIGQIMTNPGDAAIASGLIALAHSLDLSVIVEGVETPEQMAFLQSKNCEAIQGHVVSPPLDTRRFAILLRQWRGLSVTASA